MKNQIRRGDSTRRTLALGAALAISAVALLSASGCQTVKGAGKDLQNASTATEKAITGENK